MFFVQTESSHLIVTILDFLAINICTFLKVCYIETVITTAFDRLSFSSHIYALDFTLDDSFLLSGSSDETLMIWAVEDEVMREMSEQSLSVGPAFDAKFFGDKCCRIAAPDDTNCIQVKILQRLKVEIVVEEL